MEEMGNEGNNAQGNEDGTGWEGGELREEMEEERIRKAKMRKTGESTEENREELIECKQEVK
jgi:hypothetical protein